MTSPEVPAKPPRALPTNMRVWIPPARRASGTPARRRPRPPKPPADLPPLAREFWESLAPAVAEHWRPEFAAGFVVLCRLLARIESAPATAPASLVSQVRLLLVEFGLTPRSHAARVREDTKAR